MNLLSREHGNKGQARLRDDEGRTGTASTVAPGPDGAGREVRDDCPDDGMFGGAVQRLSWDGFREDDRHGCNTELPEPRHRRIPPFDPRSLGNENLSFTPILLSRFPRPATWRTAV